MNINLKQFYINKFGNFKEGKIRKEETMEQIMFKQF